MHCLLACLTLLFWLFNPVFLFAALLQETFESADAICDAKIREWLNNRKKHADPKRKRSRAQKNVSVAKLVEGNTPKRHTRSTRHRVDAEAQAKIFSPVTSSMVATPVAVQNIKQKNRKVKKKQKGKKNTNVRKCLCICVLFAVFIFDVYLLVLVLLACLCADDEETLFARNKKKV